MNARALTISDKDSSIVGILRSNDACRTLVILLPAATGTRIGPQRIYVEIAFALLKMNIASFSMDLPPNGDSYDNWGQETYTGYRDYLTGLYQHNLDKVMTWFRDHSAYDEIIPLSISVGCLPILQYAEEKNITRAILLAPNLLDIGRKRVNKKNFRAYKEKLFRAQTWKKLFRMQLNFGKIFSNVFNLRSAASRPAAKAKMEPAPEKQRTKVKALVILGERDQDLQLNKDFWNQYYKDHAATYYTEEVITGADHSFFGWPFKRDVKEAILKWVNLPQ